MLTPKPHPKRLAAGLAPQSVEPLTEAAGAWLASLKSRLGDELWRAVSDVIVEIYGNDAYTYLKTAEDSDRANAEAAEEAAGETRVEEPPFAMSLSRGLRHLEASGKATPAEAAAQRLALRRGDVADVRQFIASRQPLPPGTMGPATAAAMDAESEVAAQSVLKYC